MAVAEILLKHGADIHYKDHHVSPGTGQLLHAHLLSC